MLESPIRPAMRSPLQQALDRIGSAPAVWLPSSPVGVWFADDYDAVYNAVPNTSGTASPLSTNILRGQRRLFSSISYWNSISVSKSDMAVNAPDGTMTASTIAGVGNWLLFPISSQTIAAGTYTIGVTAKRNAGVDQAFCLTSDFTSSLSPVKTATAAWQRFSYTFTRASAFPISQVAICRVNTSTDADIQIENFELYEGASDLGPSVPDGNLYLGQTQKHASPSVSGNAIDLTGGGFGSIAFPVASFPQLTAIAVLSKTAAGSVYDGFLSDATSFANFTAMVDQNGMPHTSVDGSTSYGVAGLWSLINQGYHMLSHRSDGVEHQLWIDDILLFRSTKAAAAITLRDLFMGVVSNSTLGSGCKVNSFVLYDRALTATEIRQTYSVLSSRASSNGLTMAPARVLVQEGDSITAATSGPQSYSYRYGANQSPKVVGKNVSVGGSGVAALVARAAEKVDSVIPPNKSTRKFILSVFVGTNDVLTLGVNTYLANLASYCDARRSAGWTVVLCTLLPRNQTDFEAARIAANAEIRLWTTSGSIVSGMHADYICDFGAETTMGDSSNVTNATYYSDGLHPTDAGHILLESVYRAVLNAV